MMHDNDLPAGFDAIPDEQGDIRTSAEQEYDPKSKKEWGTQCHDDQEEARTDLLFSLGWEEHSHSASRQSTLGLDIEFAPEDNLLELDCLPQTSEMEWGGDEDEELHKDDVDFIDDMDLCEDLLNTEESSDSDRRPTPLCSSVGNSHQVGFDSRLTSPPFDAFTIKYGASYHIDIPFRPWSLTGFRRTFGLPSPRLSTFWMWMRTRPLTAAVTIVMVVTAENQRIVTTRHFFRLMTSTDVRKVTC
jgi:hypothetical protein